MGPLISKLSCAISPISLKIQLRYVLERGSRAESWRQEWKNETRSKGANCVVKQVHIINRHRGTRCLFCVFVCNLLSMPSNHWPHKCCACTVSSPPRLLSHKLYVVYVNAGLSVRHFGSNCSTWTTIGCLFLEIYGNAWSPEDESRRLWCL